MSVSRADLENMLSALVAETPDPRLGLFGPGSAMWRVDKESVLFLAGGRAALLQLAHPYVAHAVNQHSDTKNDPLGRFQRTFDNVYAMVFGDLEMAVKSARRVHAIHTRIVGSIDEDVGAFRRGDRYEANDESALLWVHATLIDSAVMAYDLVCGPMTVEEKRRYYAESRRFARLFGISDAVLPADWEAFQSYMQQMLDSDVIRVGQPAREIARFLFSSPRLATRPLFRWVKTMTAGLLPPRLRDEFGYAWDKRRQLAFDASVAALRRTYPKLPPRLRYVPAYVRARRRLAGKSGPDRVGRALEKLAMYGLDTKRRASKRQRPLRASG